MHARAALLILVLFVYLGISTSLAAAADALDARDNAAIKIYDYNYLELGSPNASTVLAHAAASVSFCHQILGSDNGAEPLLLQLSRPLTDKQPNITSQAQKKGADGFFGDSTGLVPLTSIKSISRIKNVSESAFCSNYVVFMKREAERYLSSCKITNDEQAYRCHNN